MKNDQMTLLGGALQKMRLPTASPSDTPEKNTLAMVGGNLSFADDAGEWTKVIDLSPDLYGFNTHNFGNAGKIGNVGPTLTQMRSSYSSTTWASNPEFFNVVDGVQIWTVPITGRYRMVLRGARQTSTQSTSGFVSADLNLVKGEKLRIVVGQVPVSSDVYGGCGATAVYLENGLIPLVVAGGAGGYVGSHTNRTTAALIDTVATSGIAGNNRYTSAFGNRAVVHAQGGAGFDVGCSAIAQPNYLVTTAPIANTSLKTTAIGARTYYTRAASNESDVNAIATVFAGFGGGGSGGTASWWQGNIPRGNAYSCGGGGGYIGGAAGGWSYEGSATPTVEAVGYAGRNFVNTGIRNAVVNSHTYVVSGTAIAQITLVT